MADSLRDQLIAAGFEAPKKALKKAESKTAKKAHSKKKRPTRRNKVPADRNASGSKEARKGKSAAEAKAGAAKKGIEKTEVEQAEIAKRKELKAQIKTLIDNNKLENWKGDVAYRYTVETRIRELYVNSAAHKHLTAREVAITRLNGNTYLVPIDAADEIIKTNPQWSVFCAAEKSDTDTDDSEYAEYQVPDDLQW